MYCETKITKLFILKSVVRFVCSFQIENKIQEMCDHICVLSEQPFLCSLPLGGTGTPPVNFCIGCKLTTIQSLML